MSFRNLLVMTACIDPTVGGGSQTHKIRRSDPQMRSQDYETALRFWLQYADPRINHILFIENTGYPLDALQKIATHENSLHKQVEFISLVCNQCPPGVQYGYAELNMLDVGLAQSELFKQCDYLIKVTGRLMFPALSRLLDRLPQHYDFAIDCRRNSVGKHYKFVTTQLMIFSSVFYQKHLYNLKEKLSTQVPSIENLLYFELIQHAEAPGSILRWSINVDPVGYAAHSGQSYQSQKKQIASGIRSLCRKLLPNWWV